VARRDAGTGEWSLSGKPSPRIPEVIQALQSLAAEEWQALSTSRVPLTRKL
jgi:hypothetical protein